MSGLPWDALRVFRDRMYRAYDLAPPIRRTVSSDNRTVSAPLHVTFIPNQRSYGDLTAHAAAVASAAATEHNGSSGARCPGPLTALVMDFRETFLWEDQMKIVSETDIIVSGFLLPDGAVVINVGAHQLARGEEEALYYCEQGYPSNGTVHFQDEYLSSSINYVRNLYADPNQWRRGGPGLPSAYIAALVCRAARLIRAGYFLPVPATSDNLSPLGRAAVALFVQVPGPYVVKATGLNPVTGEHRFECWARVEALLCDEGWFAR